jgi:hypothetical protein
VTEPRQTAKDEMPETAKLQARNFNQAGNYFVTVGGPFIRNS